MPLPPPHEFQLENSAKILCLHGCFNLIPISDISCHRTSLVWRYECDQLRLSPKFAQTILCVSFDPGNVDAENRVDDDHDIIAENNQHDVFLKDLFV